MLSTKVQHKCYREQRNDGRSEQEVEHQLREEEERSLSGKNRLD